MSVKYYNDNAEKFFSDTVNADMTNIYKIFENFLQKTNSNPILKLLDLGCGSGRDTKYFKERGYEVLPLDLSEELAKKAEEYTGTIVLIKDIRDMNFFNEFNGIWACASLLHVPEEELKNIFDSCYNALKNTGIMYASFKYGESNYEKDTRNFTCLTEKKADKILSLTKFEKINYMITADVRNGREHEKWLNIFLFKGDNSNG